MAEGFTCEVEEPYAGRYRSACEGLDFYGEHEGNRYCVLHFPGEEKREDFEQVKKSKLAQKDYDFGGTVFPEGTSDFRGFDFDADANFAGVTFIGEANFASAQFSGERTSFGVAQFSGQRTDFSEAQFSGERAWFAGAQFSGQRTDFSSARFSGKWTQFGDAKFSSERTHFSFAHFNGQASFQGSTDFGGAEFSGKRTFFESAHFSNGETNFHLAQFSGEHTYFSEAQFNGKKTTFASSAFSAEHTDFSSAQFSGEDTNFAFAQFRGEDTSFARAKFSGEGTGFVFAKFSSERTYFSEAQFSGGQTSFREAKFNSQLTAFHGAEFSSKETSFESAVFASPKTEFGAAIFREEVAFRHARSESPQDFFSTVFEGDVDFSYASFDKSVKLRGKVPEVDGPHIRQGEDLPGTQFALTGISIEEPDASLFQTVALRPSWLVNVVDVRKLRLIDVSWREVTLEKELEVLAQTDAPHELLARTCRELSANYEENRDYPLANDFYYWSMEALRKAHWRRLGLIRTMYWALSGYGVKPGLALGVLVAIWVTFAALYVLVPSSEFYAFSPSNSGPVISEVEQATVYSLGAIARLNPQPKPDPGWFQFLVTLEGLLGPLQIALLVLAIRRKVMR